MSQRFGQKIGAVARQLGLQSSAVRFYERQGLLASSRLSNGYRVYGREAVEALRFIVRAKELGFTLGQIHEVLSIRRAGREPCGCVKEIVDRNLDDIDRKVKALAELRRELKKLAAPQTRPAKPAPICPIIETAR
jgi:DNA-binding transcriptional MerR regulator